MLWIMNLIIIYCEIKIIQFCSIQFKVLDVTLSIQTYTVYDDDRLGLQTKEINVVSDKYDKMRHEEEQEEEIIEEVKNQWGELSAAQSNNLTTTRIL